jgi:hypothetical protein
VDNQSSDGTKPASLARSSKQTAPAAKVEDAGDCDLLSFPSHRVLSVACFLPRIFQFKTDKPATTTNES